MPSTLMGPDDLQAIRERAKLVPKEPQWPVYMMDGWSKEAQIAAEAAAKAAPADRVALLAHIDAVEGEGSDRCRAVQVICRSIVEAGGQAPDGTILDMAERVEALLRAALAEVERLTPKWQDGDPPAGPVWREGEPLPVVVQGTIGRRWFRYHDLNGRPWGKARWRLVISHPMNPDPETT